MMSSSKSLHVVGDATRADTSEVELKPALCFAADLGAPPNLDLSRLPVFSQPTDDIAAGNHISRVHVAVYERGLEVTVGARTAS